MCAFTSNDIKLKMGEAEIYLVRHGETQWNTEGRFQGRLDSALTSTGLKQAASIGRLLARLSLRVETFVASPLGRTVQTASIIADISNLPSPQYDNRLVEVSLGSWDGLTHIDIDAQWPGALDGSTPFDWYFRSPDGESYDTALERVSHWLEDQQGVTIAVSHGLTSRIIRGAYGGLFREEALSLPVPQDVVWRLSGGKIEPVPVN